MELCSKCGFILHTRPGLLSKDGVCQACINAEKKKTIDFAYRQKWLTNYIKDNKTNKNYDCVIAVSGGKDSHMIVKRLMRNHEVKNPLLVSVTDEFTHTEAGRHNINNLVSVFNLDLITFRCKPETFKENTYLDFKNELHPLKWIEEKIYKLPVEIAQAYGIKLIFFGENSDFEYGTSDQLNSIKFVGKNEIIFMGAIYPYSISDSLREARSIGFRDCDYYGEWYRQGSIENYTQIDSVAYLVQLWTKFPKFGFQRVSDIACRKVREGEFSRDQALSLIKKYDRLFDPRAKKDFCDTINITKTKFDEIVSHHINKDLVYYDVNGELRRKDDI